MTGKRQPRPAVDSDSTAARPSQLTRILIDLRRGDRSALDRLMPLVHEELHALAEAAMRNERSAHTLQATALVNEAYMRLVDLSQVEWKDRVHFFAVAAGVMRRILIDHERRHRAEKRGGGKQREGLVDEVAPSAENGVDLLALDEALERLRQVDERASRVVELRFFGGLTVDETAEALGVSPRTARGDWYLARAWLNNTLNP